MRSSFLFFFTHTAPTEIYTLSLHDALPICSTREVVAGFVTPARASVELAETEMTVSDHRTHAQFLRSEEHTSELQSRGHLVCRLLLEKKKNTQRPYMPLETNHHTDHVAA